MYVILTYDVDASRVQRVCNYLRTFLPRVQNSVFEGEITESRLERLKAGLARKIETDTDSVLIWVLRDVRWVDRQVVGTERNTVSRML